MHDSKNKGPDLRRLRRSGHLFFETYIEFFHVPTLFDIDLLYLYVNSVLNKYDSISNICFLLSGKKIDFRLREADFSVQKQNKHAQYFFLKADFYIRQ